ncbi:MSHA biogenesis protein MshK [Photobacterium sp. WH77]|uniref:MSHA biogenesis protein MshK n=1 Tax=unclassified Photobacterium TaxID=2628852 RepID=UPI001C472821|nr:MSHA biogenesis protein MshK [Photobacterium sp. 2_MG-2023]MBV7262074.1 MSHA biogenesis protein MshK [Photobacterium sp. WH24]MCG2836534.1 MSHA biogenesis protein MshK [Photobacterium sp. WH77]MCG2844339.1 MSHA biogenesis protein MshK [Photobacterium sp. WH80]MDO6583803.1 MSHA biogenesis protein MshK [Photobacterium sp. 2_MG-2023]
MVRQCISLLLLALFSTATLAESDPTAPLGWQAPSVKKTATQRLPSLEGIVCPEQDQCSVILNSQVVLPGEAISGYTLKAVDGETVILQRGSRQWRLALYSEEITINE